MSINKVYTFYNILHKWFYKIKTDKRKENQYPYKSVLTLVNNTCNTYDDI